MIGFTTLLYYQRYYYNGYNITSLPRYCDYRYYVSYYPFHARLFMQRC